MTPALRLSFAVSLAAVAVAVAAVAYGMSVDWR